MQSDYDKNKIRTHWDKQAGGSSGLNQYFTLSNENLREFICLYKSNTLNDKTLRELEILTLINYLNDGQKVLDIGCGDGMSSLIFSALRNIELIGMDFSKKSVEIANKSKRFVNTKSDRIKFVYGDVLELNKYVDQQFDIVITERCLINITDWNLKKKAISNIFNQLLPGGLFLMLEGELSGLSNLNKIRKKVNLQPIEVVWHNKFFDQEKLINFASQLFDVIEINNFSSTYMLISRVLNNALHPEKYNKEMDEISLLLPKLGNYGYLKVFVFKKKGD